MLIGVPREVKDYEYRVALVPSGVAALTASGHQVLVEQDAGLASGISNAQYTQAGAEIVATAASVWQRAEMIVKVKEPIASEYSLLQEEQILFTYLHLSAEPQLAEVLQHKHVNAIAYETIELQDGSLPLLIPMSEVAGRMAVQLGARLLEKSSGGKGIMLGGVPGVQRGRVTIIGGGTAGSNAAKIAVGMGAQVTIIDISQRRLAALDDIFGNNINTLMSNADNIATNVQNCDLLIGAVLLTGAKAPQLVTAAMIDSMEAGSVVVDVAIDQGGCIATSRPTTHAEPSFTHADVIHSAITNMPGIVPRTSTYAITNVTFTYVQQLADLGLNKALDTNAPLHKGLNTSQGRITHQAVAMSLQG